ncbi:MAG TPA: lactate utilization protein, partial [Candidatus Acidoferrum sp.]|nr:lactate utilization protein [Candidatus Acidoferrum sp.]
RSVEFPPLGQVMPPIDPVALVPKFEEELRNVAGNPHRVTNRQELEGLFRVILKGSPRVVLSRNLLLSQLGLEDTFRAWGLEVAVWPSLGASEAAIGGFRDRCFEAEFGITGVDFALAETGSLILSSLTEGSQLASLAPPVHIALYRRSQVLGSLEEVLEQAHLAHLGDAGRSIVFITGTSRTADIEQILIRGVHGPRDVHAILVEEACLRQCP